MAFSFSKGLGLFCMVLWAGGCVAPMDWSPVVESDPVAVGLLDASVEAHGGGAFDRLRDINVSYDGRWHNNVGRLQPKLVDEDFRKASQERLLLDRSWTLGQMHRGPGGVKRVYRSAAATHVAYNGMPTQDAESVGAAAAVADAYAMFLTGPFYFKQSKAPVVMAKPNTVDGHPCDQIMAVLTPGFGMATEDRVLIAIDKKSKLVRRVRFSFEGLKSTRGVVADVFLREHHQIDGVWWPTDFEEIVRRPIQLMVHRWRLTGFDTNRGVVDSELRGEEFAGKAKAPARPLEPSRSKP